MNKRYTSTILAALLGMTAACEIGPVNWPEALKCAPGVSDLIGVVSEVLLGTSDVKTELESLALTHGTSTIVCMVERLRSDWSAPGAAASPARVLGVQRADAFLAEVGTKFE